MSHRKIRIHARAYHIISYDVNHSSDSDNSKIRANWCNALWENCLDNEKEGVEMFWGFFFFFFFFFFRYNDLAFSVGDCPRTKINEL